VVKLEILFRVRGNVEEAAVKRRGEIEREKYCSVAATLQKTATILWRYGFCQPGDEQ